MVTTVAFDLVGNTATVTPVAPLLPATIYTVTVTDDLIDLAHNPLQHPTIWQFTTSTSPRVTGRAPGINAASVAVDAVVVATFNEPIFGGTSVSFGLATTAGPVNGTLSFASMSTQVTFTPFTQLSPNQLYTVTLSPAIVDVVANSLVGAPVNWSFTTGPDTIGPTLLSHVPEADRVFVLPNTSVLARFDEAVIVDTASFTLTSPGGMPVPANIVQSGGGRNASLRPDPDLLPNTTYTAVLSSAVTDASGNPLAGAPVSWSFTTEPL